MFLGFLLGFLLGCISTIILLVKEVTRIQKEKYELASRELITFLKLNEIKQIIEKSGYIKENCFTTIEKIKEVISSDQTNK